MRQLFNDLGPLRDILFIEEPAQLGLTRWNGRNKKFHPNRMNPSLHVYPRTVVYEIAKSVGIKDNDEVKRLRLLLAFAAENVFRRFQAFGGPATRNQKSNWARNVRKRIKALDALLIEGAERSFPCSGVDADYKEERPVSNPIFEYCLDLRQELEDFDDALDQIVIGSIPKGYNTAHDFYLQYMVNCLTYVFARLFGRREIKRVTDQDGTYGPFPLFIRLSVPALIKAYYPSASYRVGWGNAFKSVDRSYEQVGREQPFKLDRQIQKAVELYQD